jgi:hypothetical protein
MNSITLQINLSAGDLQYVDHTVPALVDAHRDSIEECLAIVDCCRPQETRMVDPEEQFPQPEFSEKVERIAEATQALKEDGWIDRIYYLTPDDELIPTVQWKYARSLVDGTHDFKGCGWASYLAGFEEVNTKYMVHYDADMILYQKNGYSWLNEGIRVLRENSDAIAASPRVAPPFQEETGLPDATSRNDLESDAFSEEKEDHWKIYWFSNRCYLVDIERFEHYAPFVRGMYALEVLARRLLGRNYPPSTEMMIHKTVTEPQRGYRADLMTEKAFLLHPNEKSEAFNNRVDEIIKRVDRKNVPKRQKGWEDIKIDEWE